MFRIQPVYFESFPFWEPRFYGTSATSSHCRGRAGRIRHGCRTMGANNKLDQLNLKHRTHETSQSYKIVIDAPGVKVSDIQVERMSHRSLRVTAERTLSNNATSKYEQVFVFDSKKVRGNSVSAKYEDGVLTIDLPKEPAVEPVAVAVATEYPPEGDNVSVTVDMPGVKADAIHVTLIDKETVKITGTRKTANRTVRTKRFFTVDHDKVDTLKAYLKDGVLTITTSDPGETSAETLKNTSNETGSNIIPIQIPASSQASNQEITPPAEQSADPESSNAMEAETSNEAEKRESATAVVVPVDVSTNEDTKEPDMLNDAVAVETVDESKLDD